MNRFSIIILVWAVGLSNVVRASEPVFEKNVAKNLVAICNYWLNGKIEGVDSTFVDPEYKLLYESKLYKMDNRWQMWQKGDDAMVINLRGTTREAISWMENFYAAMIPSEGDILLPDSQKVHYKFAADPRAHVHVGWAMGVSFMIEDILKHIKEANSRGIYKIYITGHSQGGALAHLTRAFLQYLPESKVSKKNEYIVYAFAPPKPGNRFFAYDYASYTSFNNSSYSIINVQDWVPQVPLSVQSPENMVALNPFASLERNEFKLPFFKRIFAKKIYNSMKNPVKKAQKRFRKVLGRTMEKQIAKKVGDFVVPSFVNDFAYFPVGLTIPLQGIGGECKDTKMKIFWEHLPANYYILIEKQIN